MGEDCCCCLSLGDENDVMNNLKAYRKEALMLLENYKTAKGSLARMRKLSAHIQCKQPPNLRVQIFFVLGTGRCTVSNSATIVSFLGSMSEGASTSADSFATKA